MSILIWGVFTWACIIYLYNNWILFIFPARNPFICQMTVIYVSGTTQKKRTSFQHSDTLDMDQSEQHKCTLQVWNVINRYKKKYKIRVRNFLRFKIPLKTGIGQFITGTVFTLISAWCMKIEFPWPLTISFSMKQLSERTQ